MASPREEDPSGAPEVRFAMDFGGGGLGLRVWIHDEPVDERICGHVPALVGLLARYYDALMHLLGEDPSLWAVGEILCTVGEALKLLSRPSTTDRHLVAAAMTAFLRGHLGIPIRVDDLDACPQDIRNALRVAGRGPIRIVSVAHPWTAAEVAALARAAHWPAGQWWEPEHVSQAESRAIRRIAKKARGRSDLSRHEWRFELLLTRLAEVVMDHLPRH